MYGPTRYICDVIEEMRKCYETRNFGYIIGLIEECQMLANRMESKLTENNGVETLHDQIKTLKKESAKLETEKENISSEIESLKEEIEIHRESHKMWMERAKTG